MPVLSSCEVIVFAAESACRTGLVTEAVKTCCVVSFPNLSVRMVGFLHKRPPLEPAVLLCLASWTTLTSGLGWTRRLAPLSEGRIEPSDGTLMCSYHGWRFAGDGACKGIPQAADGRAEAAAMASPRACAVAHPAQVRNFLPAGAALLFVAFLYVQHNFSIPYMSHNCLMQCMATGGGLGAGVPCKFRLLSRR